MSNPQYIKREDWDGQINIYEWINHQYICIYSNRNDCFMSVETKYLLQKYNSGHKWYHKIDNKQVLKYLAKAL